MIFSVRRIVGSAPGYFPAAGSGVKVVIRVRVYVNRVRVRTGDGNVYLSVLDGK